jgi:acetyl esterase/lipase
MRYVHWFMVFLALCLNVSAWSQEAKKQETPKAEAKKEGKKEEKKIPVPAVPITEANVPYGTHERQVLDFWKANSDQPTPVAFCIHGGGWRGGDKNSYYGGVKAFLDQGISVVAINYRLIKLDGQSDTNPPVKAPLEDALKRQNGISIKNGLVPPEVPPAVAPRSGSPFTTTWLIPTAAIQLPANQRGSIVPV